MTPERRTAARLAAPTINVASLVYGLDAYMRSRGADAGDAFRRAGLEPGDLTDPDRRVPLIRYLELLEICADLVADPQFGLKFGAQYEQARRPRRQCRPGLAHGRRSLQNDRALSAHHGRRHRARRGSQRRDRVCIFLLYRSADDVVPAERRLGDRLHVQPHTRRARRSPLDPAGGPAAAVGGRNAGATPHPRRDHGRQHPGRPSLGRHPV